MRTCLVVLLLCLGCASSAPTTYNQASFSGVPARPPPPRAPSFSPAEDAPHTFRPGEQRPSVEPGPRPTRVLPETQRTMREPGIWSSSGPQGDGKPPPINWNVPLPEDDDEAAERIAWCAKAMKSGSAKALYSQRVEQFDRTNIAWRWCWPHLAIAHCLNESLMASKSATEKTILARAIDSVHVAVDEKCSGGAMWSPGLTNAVGEAWERR